MENSWFSFGNCENSKEVLTFPLTTSLACTCLGVHHKLTTESLCFTRVYVTLLQKKTYIVCIYTCMHTHTVHIYILYIYIILYIYTYVCVRMHVHKHNIIYICVCLCVVCVFACAFMCGCVIFYIGQISGPAICTAPRGERTGTFRPSAGDDGNRTIRSRCTRPPRPTSEGAWQVRKTRHLRWVGFPNRRSSSSSSSSSSKSKS